MPQRETTAVAASSWDAHWRDRGAARASWSKRRILQILEPLLRPETRVLDAGCGSGFFAAEFIRSGCWTVAIDNSAAAIDLARRTTGGRCADYVLGDLLDARTVARFSGAFDLVFSDGLIEHFDRDRQLALMETFGRLCARGGKVATFAPNRWSAWRIVRPFFMRGISEKPLSVGALAQLHERADLSIEASGGLNVLPTRLSPERLARRFGMLVWCIGSPRKVGAP